MDKGLITEQTLSDIASAIRDVYGEADTYYPSEFADKIKGITYDPTTNGLWVDYGSGYVAYALTGTTIPSSTFQSATSLIGAKWNQCTGIDASAFRGATALTEISFPACTSIGSFAFQSCKLRIASFPACTSIGVSAFNGCGTLALVSFPACTSIGSYAFGHDMALPLVSFPACTYIGDYAFYRCIYLSSVYLMAGQVVSLGGSSVFYYTRETAQQNLLSIYVPSSLYSAYLSATYWSALSSRLYSA